MEGFGEDLGKVWGEIWEDLDVFFQLVAKFWKHLEKFGPAVAKLLNWTPALIREASQCLVSVGLGNFLELFFFS